MQERFPLAQSLWLEWLADEVEGDAEPPRVTALYELATADYLSIPIWADYIRWVKSSQLAHAVFPTHAVYTSAADEQLLRVHAGTWVQPP